jgi:hypothetical protein
MTKKYQIRKTATNPKLPVPAQSFNTHTEKLCKNTDREERKSLFGEKKGATGTGPLCPKRLGLVRLYRESDTAASNWEYNTQKTGS